MIHVAHGTLFQTVITEVKTDNLQKKKKNTPHLNNTNNSQFKLNALEIEHHHSTHTRLLHGKYVTCGSRDGISNCFRKGCLFFYLLHPTCVCSMPSKRYKYSLTD